MNKKLFLYISFLLIIFVICVFYCHSKEKGFSGEEAFGFLKVQCDMGFRYAGTKGHELCREFIKKRLLENGFKVVEQPFIYKGKTYYNIYGELNNNAKDWVLLAAHWDTRPFADRDSTSEKRKTPILGANDGASGVAVLLELAGILKDKKYNKNNYILTFFDGEDWGSTTDTMFLGSRYLSEHFIIPMAKWGVLIDMIGDSDLHVNKEANSYILAKDLTEKIWKKAVKLYPDVFNDELTYKISDDHLYLNKCGIPTALMIDFEYPYWHTVSDTPEKCSPASLQIIGDLLLKLVLEI